LLKRPFGPRRATAAPRRCWLDLDVEGGSCGFDVNGKSFGNAFAPLPPALQGVALFPCVSMRNAQLAVSFSELKYPKEGFVPISKCPQLRAGLSKDQNQYESTKKRQKSGRSVSAIILEPARDLAEQTHDCIESYARYLQDPHVKCALLIGGINTKEAEQALRNGDVDIVTGTPLKVWDLVKRGIMDVDACRFFTLDEADRFIETDDVATCLKIFEKLPKGASATARDRRLQVAFFSATLHSEAIKDLSRKVCDNPTWCRQCPVSMRLAVASMASTRPSESLRASWERWRCRLDAVVAIARESTATASPIDAFDALLSTELTRVSAQGRPQGREALTRLCETFSGARGSLISRYSRTSQAVVR
jgi:hypothetical protein